MAGGLFNLIFFGCSMVVIVVPPFNLLMSLPTGAPCFKCVASLIILVPFNPSKVRQSFPTCGENFLGYSSKISKETKVPVAGVE